MENRTINLAKENAQVVDGRVVIDSEELAKAIEDCGVNPLADEEADFSINFGCHLASTK